MTPKSDSGILVGYEVGTGDPVYMAPKHTMIAGMTGDAGKTTAIEGIADRWPGQKFVVFLAKPGEQAFEDRRRIRPFFRQRAGWQYVEALIQASLGEKIKIVRTTLIKVCEGTKDLNQVFGNVSHRIAEYDSKHRGGFEYDMLIQTREYLRQVLKELESHDLADSLDLQDGINVVDMADFTPVMQAMIVGAISEEILRKHTHTSIVIPEAWQTIPGDRGSPATAAVEALIRQGRVRHNFVLIDSQDIAGVNTKIRRHIANYLLGKQQDEHEIERTLKAIPLPARSKPKADEVQTLKLGQFFAIVDEKLRKIYARPSWMDEGRAVAIAKDHSKITGTIDRTLTLTLGPVTVHPGGELSSTNDEQVASDLDQAMITSLQEQVISAQKTITGLQDELKQVLKELEAAKEKADAEESRANEYLARLQESDKLTTSLWEFALPRIRQEFKAAFGGKPQVLHAVSSQDGEVDVGVEDVQVNIVETLREEKLTEDTLAGKLARLIRDGCFDQATTIPQMREILGKEYGVSITGGKEYKKLTDALDLLSSRPYRLLERVDVDGKAKVAYKSTEKGRTCQVQKVQEVLAK